MPHTKRPRILLVDDDASMRGVVRRMLRTTACELLEAESLSAALKVAAKATGPVDLLLSDVVMPHGNGPTLAARLREQWQELRVLYMSGYDRQTLNARGLLGETPVIIKPFTPQVLREAVQLALAGPAATE